MNTALSWIRAYVPELEVSDREYFDAMTLSGTKCEGYTRLDKNLEKIVVGQIKRIDRHPDADKLIVCQVEVGRDAAENDTGVIQIVTGANNVREGNKVPIVLNGGKVAGGHDGGPLPENGVKIKAGKLRGVESNGMMCSIEELGSDRNHYPDAPEDGIYILPDDAGIGADAVELLGLRDTVFEYEITSNRVDCYSILGIAREAAATFRKEFKPPVVTLKESADRTEDFIKVRIEDADLCTRYCARVCTNVKIAPSPRWMQRRLSAQGIRPINNLVDITNYVMLEYGQPMHGYDLDTIAGHEIIVRRAKDGDVFTTLDGQERKLDHDVLMICDAEKEVGIGGIMGGENSMITDSVKTVLFEAATFNGANIRKSAKRIGLRTDASSIFEKGLDPHNAEAAINRACQLMQELGAGDVAQGVVDVHSPMKDEVVIPFEPAKINKFLGTDIPQADMVTYLTRLELSVDEDKMTVTVPTFRQDVLEFADVAEEVARFYGYDKIPTTLPRGEATMGGLSPEMQVENIARSVAEANGYSQGMTFSFESPKVFDRLLLAETSPLRRAVEISNPLGEDFSIMRTTTLNGMLTSLAANYNRRNKNVKLYEMGRVYLPVGGKLPIEELPDERVQFTLGFYTDGKNGEDFFTLKGVAESFLDALGIQPVTGTRRRLSYEPNAGIFYRKQEDALTAADAADKKEADKLPFLHPGRQAALLYDESPIGYLGEVHPYVRETYEIGERAYLAVIDLKAVLPLAHFDRKYEGVAKFPAVNRDISMTVPKNVMVGQIESVLSQRGGKILEAYRLFDIYEGEQIKEGYKSVAYSITFRAKDRTLEDTDVSAVMKKILNGLEALGIELRQ